MHDTTLFALLAQVKVHTLSASVTSTCLNLSVALIAGAGKGGGLWVVQVVEKHHAAVLCPTQCVELVVIALAE